MSLLTLCEHVARSIPVAAPSVIVGSTDETARLLLACAQDEGEALARRHNWTVLQNEHSFDTVASTAEYDLPSDFGRIIDGTAWDRDNFRKMRGPLSPQQWQVEKSGLGATVGVFKDWRIKPTSAVDKFVIDPTPSAAETLVFEYVSNAWCQSSAGTAQSEWKADADTGIVDEYLIRLGVKWRMLDRLGLSYLEAKDEYDSECDRAVARDGGAQTLSLTRSRRFVLPTAQVPDTGFGP